MKKKNKFRRYVVPAAIALMTAPTMATLPYRITGWYNEIFIFVSLLVYANIIYFKMEGLFR